MGSSETSNNSLLFINGWYSLVPTHHPPHTALFHQNMTLNLQIFSADPRSCPAREMTFGPKFADLHSSPNERQLQKSCISFGEE